MLLGSEPFVEGSGLTCLISRRSQEIPACTFHALPPARPRLSCCPSGSLSTVSNETRSFAESVLSMGTAHLESARAGMHLFDHQPSRERCDRRVRITQDLTPYCLVRFWPRPPQF